MLRENKQDRRPNPDDILDKIVKESRGQLTVFLGAAAGVGKTYAMLEAAHGRLEEDIDVVIGWIETHGRQETERIAAGIAYIPARVLEYRGKQLLEMDIDAILERNPELVLVDELAHTNVTGSRHVRRFQDVAELLAAGINVYTTLNIQHVESLNDIVAQITGVIVRETVPDRVLEQADIIRLIDIPPQDLIQRLKEGKVYIPGQVEQALNKFFRPGNISALRELALRFTAKRVDKDINEYMREHDIEGPWPAAERVMVGISASPFSAQLIRTARRLAGGLHAEWLAVHVETTKTNFPIGSKERERIARNIQLAEELGAQVLTVVGDDLTHEILEVARTHNVTAIVVGKPRHGRLRDLWHGSIINKLIRHSGRINVYVIQADAEAENVSQIRSSNPVAQKIPWSHYAGGVLIMAVVAVLTWLLRSKLELVNVALLYQLPVTLSAYWWGRWPSYFTALCSVFIFDVLYIAPIGNMEVEDVRFLWSFVTFLIVAFVIGGRTELLRHEAILARQRERSTRSLYEFSREIAAVSNLEMIADGMARKASETLERPIIILLPDSGGTLIVWSEYGSDSDKTNSNGKPLQDASEAAVALWAYTHGENAGCTTETLPGANYLYIPIKTQKNILGIFAIHTKEKRIEPEQQRLISAWVGLAAIAIERVKLAEQARAKEII
jgi:two-component system sensor histidine kinase KdpD